MILQRLVEYYNRIPEQEIARFGYAPHGISFCLVLERDGRLSNVLDLRTQDTKGRLLPVELAVPDFGSKRTSAVRPNFLWDKTAYVLGRDAAEESKSSDGAAAVARLREQFEEFRALHLRVRANIIEPEFGALCTFLTTWNPDQIDSVPDWQCLSGSNVVFKIRGESRGYLHDLPDCRRAWLEILEAEEHPTRGFCLVTAQEARIARLHPAIKGVYDPGGQAEKSLVSINTTERPAFGSYGKEQCDNAPVGTVAAFQYATALNRLTKRERRIHLGNATVVYWSDQPTLFEDEVFGVFESRAAEDGATLDRLKGFFNRLCRAAEGASFDEGNVSFFVLGLSPNGPRLSVRFWLAGTVHEFAKRLGRHLADLEIVGQGDAAPLTLRRLIHETARPKNGWPDENAVSPLLSGSVLTAVLAGTRYPTTLLTAIIERIRVEGFAHSEKRRDWLDAMHRRAAIVKAYLIRNKRKDIPVSLSKNHPDVAYHLGRLFAVLEKTQEEAYDQRLNVTIKDRFLSSASANPVTAFPRLLRLHAHHLAKLEHGGRRTNLEKLVQEVCSHCSEFPAHLPLDEQGIFFIGYYHQRQDFFTSKKPDTEANEITTSADGAQEE